MKLRITQSGVFAPNSDKSGEREVPIGTEIEIKGDAVPASLIGKCEVVAKIAQNSTPITNPKKGGKK